jgi:two-component system cell cycle sensor histidine kinase/response regulator CckA
MGSKTDSTKGASQPRGPRAVRARPANRTKAGPGAPGGPGSTGRAPGTRVSELEGENAALQRLVDHLREGEARYRMVSRLTSDYVFQVDVGPDGGPQLTLVSDRYALDTGRTLDQARTPEHWARMVHPADAERFFSVMRRLLADGGKGEFEGRFFRADGTPRWVHVDVEALKDAACQKTSSILGAVADITARKEAEEGLKLLKHSIDAAPYGAYWIDQSGRFVYVNDQGCRALGYSRDELLDMTVGEVNPKATPARWAEVWQSLKSTGSMTLESEHRRKDGSVFPVELTSAYFSFGDRDYCNGFAVDVTERKKAESERRKLEAQLAQSQKMESIGRLAGGVAHDFNNMLGVILGHAEMALGEIEPDNPLHADLLEIQKAAERSADLTRQLLAFARRQTVSPRVLDLNETIDGMLKMLRRLIGEDISLAWVPGRELSPVKVDPSQINQVLANLCVNARDAIDGVGTIIIETASAVFDEASCADRRDATPGRYVMLAVGDDGCGMTREVLEHLFEPFYTTKGPREGTGLGLATVYGIVRQNGGFVTVDSEPGMGATFRVYLPEHAGRAAAHPVERTGLEVEAGKETILLVEDEPAILKVVTRMLGRIGYKVLAAGTPGEALQVAGDHRGDIHLLIADVVMPEMNGRELAKQLLAEFPAMKRLFMSGYTADVIAHRGVLEEGVHFIQKPFTSAGLSAKVREVLEKG